MSAVTFVTYAPLLNFKSAITRVAFADDLRIRKIHANERRRILRDESHLGLGMQIALGDATHVAERRQDATKSQQMSDEPFDRIIMTLRLLRSGDVGFNYIASKHLVAHRGRNTTRLGSGATWSDNRPPLGREIYLFSDSLRRNAKHLFTKLEMTHSVVQVALDRFSFAYERSRPEDRLVDHWVGLEALFLKSTERARLSYRASLRAANLIGDNPRSKAWIFNLSRESYNVRSKIVHGEPTPKKAYPLVTFTSELLRLTLHSCVLAGEAPDLDSLDLAAARGGGAEATPR